MSDWLAVFATWGALILGFGAALLAQKRRHQRERAERQRRLDAELEELEHRNEERDARHNAWLMEARTAMEWKPLTVPESPVERAARALREAADALDAIPPELRRPDPGALLMFRPLLAEELRAEADHIEAAAARVIEATTPT